MLEGNKFINLFINFSFLQKSVSKTVILLVFVSKMILLSNGLVEEIYLICNNNDLLLLRAIEDNLEKCSHIKKEKNKLLYLFRQKFIARWGPSNRRGGNFGNFGANSESL